ncbi:MAG: hypothetical protein V4724_25735 [Pseudomonadota bacterium]
MLVAQVFRLACLTVSLALSVSAMAAPPTVYLARTENEPLIDVTFTILKEAYRRIGVDAQEKTLPGERSLSELNAGEYFGDVMHIAGLEKVYTNLVPVPLIHFDAVAFTDGRHLQLAGWTDLQPYRVCIRRGIKAIELATTGIAQVNLVNQYEFIFRMLKLGRCEVAVLPYSSWLLAERQDLAGLRSLEPPLQSWPLYHYVHQSHADIIPALTQALLALQKNGFAAERQAEFARRVEEARRAAVRQP